MPTAGIYDGNFRRHIDDTGLGYPREIDLIEECNRRGVFTIAYAFTPNEALRMADAGADVIGAHVGLTVGGYIGASTPPPWMTPASRSRRWRTPPDRRAGPGVFVVAHGGPFDEPAAVQAAYARTDVDGFLGASSIERLPVERAISETVGAFRSLTLRSR